MHKRFSFWAILVIAGAVWLSGNVALRFRAQARPLSLPEAAPLGQPPECTAGPDLWVSDIRVEPDPPGVGQSYNIHVEIANAGTVR